ncbi:hypothetical protein PGT21_026887 [Puccinia graminis f. sp. tritici]|uniref:Uncharacterized protein n=1 Tax=Puccinia graminis f. sp. tritici TaxID=56615 RepID=A0A5B0QJJ2_PUCGR|nr:hypothetical protein PGT21_026887 [Puccinia graminis f. sp. tritici]
MSRQSWCGEIIIRRRDLEARTNERIDRYIDIDKIIITQTETGVHDGQTLSRLKEEQVEVLARRGEIILCVEWAMVMVQRIRVEDV